MCFITTLLDVLNAAKFCIRANRHNPQQGETRHLLGVPSLYTTIVMFIKRSYKACSKEKTANSVGPALPAASEALDCLSVTHSSTVPGAPSPPKDRGDAVRRLCFVQESPRDTFCSVARSYASLLVHASSLVKKLIASITRPASAAGTNPLTVKYCGTKSAVIIIANAGSSQKPNIQAGMSQRSAKPSDVTVKTADNAITEISTSQRTKPKRSDSTRAIAKFPWKLMP